VFNRTRKNRPLDDLARRESKYANVLEGEMLEASSGKQGDAFAALDPPPAFSPPSSPFNRVLGKRLGRYAAAYSR